MYGARRWSGHEWLWLAQDAESRTDTVVSLNALNDRLVGSRQRTIWYHGVEGDSLMGKIIFPVDYVLGRRYPMIVDGYAGGGPDGPIMDTTSANTLDLFAAHGYVVLIPTIPLVDDTLASDPYIDLTKGVFGAIDEAIALGIADPRRLGVYGTSYGGYTTYSLLTYTHRFQAAVATAGPADLMSTYGTFNAQGRYVRDPMPILAFNFFASEGGQWRMGAMPWTNLWRYWRNSPINYLDRVDTPLLIVQGDMDFVPVQQGEEVFTGLSRLGKRVRFIRYWGEGHWANSPANQRDMWQQMLGWFDKYLQPERVAATSPVVH
jgi:dipeptidyl aminopeptidase/acylaminoacyl peptidase